MIPIRRFIRSAAVLAAAGLAGACDRPDPVPEPPPFDVTRAWSHLNTQMSHGPRYPGHRGHAMQLRWMRGQLGFRADTLVEQPFRHAFGDGPEVELTNLVARFNPEAEERVLLVAHWDTRRYAEGSYSAYDQERPTPGANVNASGVAVLLEMAELFRQQRPRAGVDVLLADGDDYASGEDRAGTRHYLATLGAEDRPRYAVVLQGVGGRGTVFPMDEASLASAPEQTRRMWALAGEMGMDSLFVERTEPPLENAARVLVEAGIPTVVVAGRGYGRENAYWHSVDDLPREMSRGHLRAVGRVLAAMVYAEP